MYATTSDAKLVASGRQTFDAVKMVESIGRTPYVPANGAQYQGEFGRSLQQIARLIKADVGLEVAFADMGGWDHHSNEAPQLANKPLASPKAAAEIGSQPMARARDKSMQVHAPGGATLIIKGEAPERGTRS